MADKQIPDPAEAGTSGPGDEDTLKRLPPPAPGAQDRKQDMPLVLPGQGPFSSAAHTEDTIAGSAISPVSAGGAAAQGHLPPAYNAPTAPQVRASGPGAAPLQQPWDASMRQGTPGRPGRSANYKMLWLLVTAASLILIAIIVGLLFIALPSLSSPGGKGVSQQPVSAVTATPSPASATSLLEVLPDRFGPQNCQVDNGYRCTATVMLTQGNLGTFTWSAFGSGIVTRFSPPGGTVSPGQQQQVIIYVYSPCPTSGSFVFTAGGSKTTLPWSCTDGARHHKPRHPR